MTISHSTSFRTEHNDDELELPVEVVAERLGLPAAMLIRRIEAGDLPARRVEGVEGFTYHVRIADLGPSTGAVLPGEEASQEIRGTAEPLNRNGHGRRAAGEPDQAVSAPPVAVFDVDDDTASVADDDAIAVADDADELVTSALNDAFAVADDEQDEPALPEDISEAVPPPLRGTIELAPVSSEGGGPRAELAAMALDPRELVAGLLDRWERTLEQRIYAEQRQRFEAELSNRQAKVKHLQLELGAVRAEHAAALAEKERQLAERYRELSERERELNNLRNEPRRRGWFGRR
jgi:hypothetical protein